MQEDLLYLPLLSFCVSQRFWPLHAALFLRWEAGERQWHYEAEQNSPIIVRQPEFWTQYCYPLSCGPGISLTLLKPKNKVLLYIKSPGDSRPLQSSSFKNRVPRKGHWTWWLLGPPQAWLSVILWEESFLQTCPCVGSWARREPRSGCSQANGMWKFPSQPLTRIRGKSSHFLQENDNCILLLIPIRKAKVYDSYPGRFRFPVISVAPQAIVT